MVIKRMSTYRVNLRWKQPDGSYLTRGIAENGLTAKSAKNKVVKHYNTAGMIKKFGKPSFVSVISVR